MARLALIYGVMRRVHNVDLNYRRNELRLARFMDRAFALGDEEFMRHYRVSKEIFYEIYEELRHIMPQPRRMDAISIKFKILVTLSFFATGSYQRLVGLAYGTVMSQQSVSRAIRQVTEALNHPSVANKWIRFPQTITERNAVKRRFYEKFNMPSVLGCIDGTHVAMVRPNENEERFYNRKHFHSRNVLIISDADLNILSVDSSFGGASHDSFIWNQHPVKNHLIHLNNCGENVYLLGDSGYAQRVYMMTPIIDAPVGSAEEHYTKVHCSARNTVERTIGVLKNRWRCLLKHRVLHYHPDVVAKIINACCVLHNMCNKRVTSEEMETMEMEDGSEETSASQILEDSGRAAADDLGRGLQKRATLVQQLWASRRH